MDGLSPFNSTVLGVFSIGLLKFYCPGVSANFAEMATSSGKKKDNICQLCRAFTEQCGPHDICGREHVL